MSVFLTVCIWMIMGLATAHMAERKGRDPVLWFVVGLLLGVIGLALIFFMPQPKDIQKKYPAEMPESKNLISKKSQRIENAQAKPWFYLTEEGQQIGPLTFQEIKEKKKTGILTENSFVWADGMEEWRQIGNLEVQGEFDDE